MKETSPAIQTFGLSKRYGKLTAVDQLEIRVPEGIVFGFLGPNGAGKTTTIRLLLGLTEPSDGRAEIFGFDCLRQGDRVRAMSGALMENHGLYERLTALYNMKYYADIYGLELEHRERRIRELMEWVDLWERRKETIKEWSRGMKQKLALIRAMIHRPRILFLDEPTLGLDVATARKIRDTIKRLARDHNCTIFFTSHNLPEVEEICSHVAIINKGRVMAGGRPEDLKSRKGRREVSIRGEGFSKSLIEEIADISPSLSPILRKGEEESTEEITITLENRQPLDPALQKILSSGATIRDIQTRTQSLEAVFLELTREQEEQEETK